jgi:hypothetical protein
MGVEKINKYIAKNKCNKIKVMCHVIDKKKLTEFRWKYLIDSFDKDILLLLLLLLLLLYYYY